MDKCSKRFRSNHNKLKTSAHNWGKKKCQRQSELTNGCGNTTVRDVLCQHAAFLPARHLLWV